MVPRGDVGPDLEPTSKLLVVQFEPCVCVFSNDDKTCAHVCVCLITSYYYCKKLYVRPVTLPYDYLVYETRRS